MGHGAVGLGTPRGMLEEFGHGVKVSRVEEKGIGVDQSRDLPLIGHAALLGVVCLETGSSWDGLHLAHGPEELSQIAGEQGGLLHSGEMAAAGHDGPTGNVVLAFDP